MKENELRLGNYLLGYDNNYFTWNYGHYDLCSKGIYADELGMPIELTEDILLKCGFVKCSYRDNHYNVLGMVIWNCNGMFICNKNGVKLKYLHQLQNLHYCLVGYDLNVNM